MRMATHQKIDLYQPIAASRVGRPPLVLKVVVTDNQSLGEGVPVGTLRNEVYVLLSALPEEIRQRVVVAINMLQSGI